MQEVGRCAACNAGTEPDGYCSSCNGERPKPIMQPEALKDDRVDKLERRVNQLEKTVARLNRAARRN